MLNIGNATFITSVANENNFYSSNKPIIAIAGKSNVGKSSLINMLANQKKLAKTSVTPGRTRLINYFDFGSFVLADLPGYGYAKVSKEEKLKWGNLLETFLTTQKLNLLIQLVDIRHDPTEDDILMVNYLYHYRIPFKIVATKADKISRSQIKINSQNIATKLKVGISDITVSSSLNRLGREDIFKIIEKSLTV